jgi:hypothetical protein
MDGKRAVACVVRLPVDRGERSTFSYLEASGLYECPEALSFDAVEECLKTESDLVASWNGYSGDKRTSQGWYLKGREVGELRPRRRLTYDTETRACAEFIVREVAFIVSLPKKTAAEMRDEFFAENKWAVGSEQMEAIINKVAEEAQRRKPVPPEVIAWASRVLGPQ